MQQRITVRFDATGWRAVLCEDFTLGNVRLVVQGIADHLRAGGLDERGVLVAQGVGVMAERFARAISEVLAANGIRTFVAPGGVPAPAVSFDVLRHARDGAVSVAAPHTEPSRSAIRFSPAWGGPALPETTRDIEVRANARVSSGTFLSLAYEDGLDRRLIRPHDPRPAYLERLRELVDFDAIRGARLRLALDPLHGTARGYLDRLLADAGCEVTAIHSEPDPPFGGRAPHPGEKHLSELALLVRGDASFHLGLATDGDAHRFGILDAGGRFLEPNAFLALLFDYLVRERGFEGGVARSVATSHLVDRVARELGREVHETPLGFKSIGDLIRRGQVALGGEESAGLSIRGHVPERDGILACCLAAEMVARRANPLFGQLEELRRRVGALSNRRVDLQLTPAQEEALEDRIDAVPGAFAGREVVGRVNVDGTKLLLEGGSWLLVRKSGAEPVATLYVEAPDAVAADSLIEAGRAWLLGEL